MLKGILITALLVVCGAARAFDAAPLLPWVTAPTADPYLVAWYKGDGNTTDSATGNHPLAWSGNAAYVDGIRGQAFSFSGNNAVTNTGAFFGTSVPAQSTVACYVLASTNSLNVRLWNFGTTSSAVPLIGPYAQANNENVVMFWRPTDAIQYHSSAIPNVLSRTWVHLAVVRNGNTVTIYRDAVSAAVQTIDSTKTYVHNRFAIGALLRSATPELYFVGAIDEVQIYNRALSSNDVSRIYQGLIPLHD